MQPVSFGKYQVIERLGQGGFGVVYLGRDPDLKRLVAIKTCTSGDSSFQERFFREAEIAAGLQHPNIVTIFDLGEQPDGTPYMVQEYLTGEDLSTVIAGRKSPAVATRLRYLREIAAGLRYAHSQGVIHRDIKPSNVRVLEDGRIKILDFGIAKLLRADYALTRTGTALGSLGYLAPEQMRGKKVDQRADIFSFGCVAYELLTGHRPFPGGEAPAVLHSLLHHEPAPVAEVWPECPPNLAKCIDRCLRKDPDQRYTDLGPVLDELEAASRRPSTEAEVPDADPPTRIVRPKRDQAAAPASTFLTAIRLRRVTLAWAASAVAAIALSLLMLWGLMKGGGSEEDPVVALEPADRGQKQEAPPIGDGAAGAEGGHGAGGGPAQATAPARTSDTAVPRPRPAPPAPDSGTPGFLVEPETLPEPRSGLRGHALWIVVHGEPESEPGTAAAAMARQLTQAGIAVAGSREAPAAAFGELPSTRSLPSTVRIVVTAHLRCQVEPSLGRFFTGRALLDLQTYDAGSGRLLGGESLAAAELGPTEIAARSAAAREAGRRAAETVLGHLGPGPE